MTLQKAKMPIILTFEEPGSAILYQYEKPSVLKQELYETLVKAIMLRIADGSTHNIMNGKETLNFFLCEKTEEKFR